LSPSHIVDHIIANHDRLKVEGAVCREWKQCSIKPESAEVSTNQKVVFSI